MQVFVIKIKTMQKQLLFITAFVAVVSSGFTCNKDDARRISGCLKGKLEIKGICMNYVISIKEGDIDPSLLEATWQDPVTGNTYQNVFALSSPCNFPAAIDEGDEFYFYVMDKSPGDCAVCMAYSPTPQKKLPIIVSNKPCN